MEMKHAWKTQRKKLGWSEKLNRKLTNPPFTDEVGAKGWLHYFARARQTRLTKYKITLADWPSSLSLSIAFITDLHVGSHSNDLARLQTLTKQVNLLKPDLILLGGDYMNMAPFFGAHISPHAIAKQLANLKAPLGVFAVMGNHDAEYGCDEIQAAFQEANIKFLDNALTFLEFDDETIFLAGLEDDRTGRPDLAGLMTHVPWSVPGLILAHDPVSFEQVTRTNSLMLCGHTHGGQITLPFIGPIVNASRAPLKWTYGHIQDGEKQMIVSSGIGTGLPLRIGTWPEVCLITCHAKKPDEMHSSGS